MNSIEPDQAAERNSGHDGEALTALPGEAGIPSVTQARSRALDLKALLAVGLMLASLAAVSGLWIHRALQGNDKDADDVGKRVAERPMAAATVPRKLDMAPATASSAVTAASGPLIPAIAGADDLPPDPIGLRRPAPQSPSGTTSTVPAVRQRPEDAPVVLLSTRPTPPGTTRPDATTQDVDQTDGAARPGDNLQGTRRNLEAYQRQLQGLMGTLTKGVELARVTPGAVPSMPGTVDPLSGAGTAGSTPRGGAADSGGSGLFAGRLQVSATPRVVAGMLGNRSLTVPKGTSFTCALKTRVVSAASGLVGCQVQRNVYSDDGRVLLIERGTHMDGEYHIDAVRPGTVRIPVLWTRLRTPNGVTVDIDSPGTGQLGEAGVDGYVDNRWGERLGAAMLLSLIDDSVKLLIQNQSNDSQANTIVLPATTANTSKLAEKVLDSTINIPPLIYQNQGGIVGIYVARDVDFSSVYSLEPVTR
ncbi:MAG: type secretory pathway, VirB10 component [Pseudomonadota bacterium]|jgi:type IV secretion system protein VirB10